MHKNRCKKIIFFGNDFRSNFLWFGLPNGTPNPICFLPLSNMPILQKSLFSLSKIAIFAVRSLQKSIKIRYENAFRNNIEKKGSEIDFWGPVGPPKSSKIGPKSDVKRSLFRDAMEITPGSAEINGRHSFWTTNMATHMIRSSLSIYLYLYL